MTNMNGLTRALLLTVLLAPAAACASVQAKQPTIGPTLEVPPVPGRLVDPVITPDETPMPEPVPELPPQPAAPRTRPAPPAPREAPKPEPPKPIEPVPVEPPPPVAASVPPLRTPNTPDSAEASRQVREIIDRAGKTLNSIDYRFLSNERKEQYDNAKQLLTQAETALKALNFEIAKNVADKAEQIARQLQPR